MSYFTELVRTGRNNIAAFAAKEEFKDAGEVASVTRDQVCMCYGDTVWGDDALWALDGIIQSCFWLCQSGGSDTPDHDRRNIAQCLDQLDELIN